MDEETEIDPQVEPETEQEPEPEQEYQLDEYGEIEYDDNGEPILAQVDTEPEPEPEPSERYVLSTPQAGDDADDELLREGMTPELYEAMMRRMRREMASEMQTMAAANIHVTTAAAEHPELFRTYGPRIQQTLSELPATTRSRPEAVHIAIARIVMEDGPTKGLSATLRRLADMAEGGRPRAQQKPKSPAIPPEQRPPSPSSRGRDARPLSNFDRKVDLLMKDAGISKEQARVMVSSGEV